jgi:transcriptional regulator with XRE-family HTH domain
MYIAVKLSGVLFMSNLKSIRSKLNITQKQLAAEIGHSLGTSQTAISKAPKHKTYHC